MLSWILSTVQLFSAISDIPTVPTTAVTAHTQDLDLSFERDTR